MWDLENILVTSADPDKHLSLMQIEVDSPNFIRDEFGATQ
jgi:hypothetical protein